MSRMAEIDLEIRSMLDEGLRPFTIANLLGVPLQMIYDVLDEDTENEVPTDEYDESMDGDFDTGNVRYKARERYSFGVSDPLAIYGSPGA